MGVEGSLNCLRGVERPLQDLVGDSVKLCAYRSTQFSLPTISSPPPFSPPFLNPIQSNPIRDRDCAFYYEKVAGFSQNLRPRKSKKKKKKQISRLRFFFTRIYDLFTVLLLTTFFFLLSPSIIIDFVELPSPLPLPRCLCEFLRFFFAKLVAFFSRSESWSFSFSPWCSQSRKEQNSRRKNEEKKKYQCVMKLRRGRCNNPHYRYKFSFQEKKEIITTLQNDS